MSVDIPQAIEAVEAALEKMTKGPWCVEAATQKYEVDICLGYEIPDAGSPILVGHFFADDEDDCISPYPIDFRQAQRNAKGVAVLRNHAPALLAAAKESAVKDAEIERLRAENAKLREQVGHFSELADERHDLLSAERRKVDELRATIRVAEDGFTCASENDGGINFYEYAKEMRAALGKGET